ncbi:hypothetical protein [Lentzea sp. NPDC004782]
MFVTRPAGLLPWMKGAFIHLRSMKAPFIDDGRFSGRTYDHV